jgi:Zn-dependent membrane protease YugP
MLFFDPRYLIIVGPAILLAFWAQARVKSAFAKGSKYTARSGLTGAEAARQILQANGIMDVSVEAVRGFLSDHYDPRSRTLRLSPAVYQGRSLSSVGVAAHEAGHAIQDARHYAPLALRNGIVPLASTGSTLSIIFIVAGALLALSNLIWVGVILFTGVVAFQLINLPVEFDASRRARLVLLNNGMVTQEEDVVVGKVLNAAAMTYVAATITAIAQLAYFILLAGRRS